MRCFRQIDGEDLVAFISSSRQFHFITMPRSATQRTNIERLFILLRAAINWYNNYQPYKPSLILFPLDNIMGIRFEIVASLNL